MKVSIMRRTKLVINEFFLIEEKLQSNYFHCKITSYL